MKQGGLYILTPPEIKDLPAFAALLGEVLAASKAELVQLRLKEGGQPAPAKTMRNAAQHIAPVIKQAGAKLILNDAAELVSDVGADGVHLGQQDMGCTKARTLLGGNKIIGITCHNSIALAHAAKQEGANYIALGAFFPTRTKAPSTFAAPELLGECRKEIGLPLVAIGGITPENGAALSAAGADYLAVCAAIWDDSNPPRAAAQLAASCV